MDYLFETSMDVNKDCVYVDDCYGKCKYIILGMRPRYLVNSEFASATISPAIYQTTQLIYGQGYH